MGKLELNDNFVDPFTVTFSIVVYAV